MKAQIKNYQQALEYLGGKKERPYANNTRIERDTLNLGHDVITVKYHGNEIVNFYPNCTSFSSCGWKTSTTKERINWFLPEGFRLWQDKSTWYIGKHNFGTFGFMDGLTIDSDGNVYNYAAENESQAIKAQIKTIKTYVNGFVSALLAGEVESPSGGDCWDCVMKTEDGRTLGEFRQSDHIQSHIEESYYVPSMLINAFKFRDASMLAKGTIAQIWEKQEVSAWQVDITSRDVKSSLTAYLKHCLNIAA